MNAFTLLDFVLLGALALGGWRGLRAGAMRQVVGLLGAVVAFWVGAVLMEPVGAMVVVSLGMSPRVAPVVGFVLVFGVSMAALAATSHVARATLESLRIGFIDRAIGAVVGGVQTAVLLSVALLVGGGFLGSLLLGPDATQSSLLAEPVQGVAPALWDAFRSVAPGWQATLLEKFQMLTE